LKKEKTCSKVFETLLLKTEVDSDKYHLLSSLRIEIKRKHDKSHIKNLSKTLDELVKTKYVEDMFCQKLPFDEKNQWDVEFRQLC